MVVCKGPNGLYCAHHRAARAALQTHKGEKRMILADKIMELRKKNGWSQEEFAEKLNVSRQAVSK